MNKPYIYSGNLNNHELSNWLAEQLLALGHLISNENQQIHLNEKLAELSNEYQEVSTIAFAGIVRQKLDSTHHPVDHQKQSEPSLPDATNTSEHLQVGSQ
ncbi:Uncharacterised protein [Yersinia enterocolitica]|nr:MULTISPECIES: hypothetical protein [Yersinia]MDA5489476.1 hypothetical protein [Yersinia kristensenii]CFQ78109.1 Uncharacterised protein [Yersinia enterocolitica]